MEQGKNGKSRYVPIEENIIRGFDSYISACYYIPKLQQAMGMNIVRTNQQEIREQALHRMKIDRTCPCCKKGKMRLILPFGRDGPPEESYIFKYISKI